LLLSLPLLLLSHGSSAATSHGSSAAAAAPPHALHPLLTSLRSVRERLTRRRKKRILILISDTGGGHRASAQALAGLIGRQHGESIEVSIVDVWTNYAPYPFNRRVSPCPPPSALRPPPSTAHALRSGWCRNIGTCSLGRSCGAPCTGPPRSRPPASSSTQRSGCSPRAASVRASRSTSQTLSSRCTRSARPCRCRHSPRSPTMAPPPPPSRRRRGVASECAGGPAGAPARAAAKRADGCRL